MKNAVFWDVAACGSCYRRRLGGTCCLHLQGVKNLRARNNVSSKCTANVVPSSRILSITKMKAASSGTSVLTRPTRRHILEDGILRIEEELLNQRRNRIYARLHKF
jgi:hypothetical protein